MKLIMENWREFQKKTLIVEGDKKLADVLPAIAKLDLKSDENYTNLLKLLSDIDYRFTTDQEGEILVKLKNLADINGPVEEIEKLIKELGKLQNLTPTTIIVEAISSAIGEQIGEKIVNPLVDKIELAVAGGQATAAGATVATAGGASVPAALFAAALQGLKFLVKDFAKDKAKELITDLISDTISNILSGFATIKNVDGVLAEILGKKPLQLVNTVAGEDGDPKEKINTIKDIIKRNYDEILKNIFVVAAKGNLGDNAQEYTLKLINAEILKIPLGPFIGEMILGEEITADLTNDKTKQQLQQLADKGKKEAGESGEEPEPAEDEATPDEKPTGVDLNDLANRFANFIKNNELLSESIGDIVSALEIKDTKKFGKFLGKIFKREEIKIIDGLKDDELNNFIDLVKKALDPEAPGSEDETNTDTEEGATEVEAGGREYTYTDKNIQELKTAYEEFEKGFMTAPNRVEQEELWIKLRNALNAIGQFREIGRKERAYIGEQLINIFENENQQNFKRIVVDIERLRRDLNDTDDTLVKYLEAANAGKYESQAYLARFLAELKDVQNSVKRAVEDVQKVGGFKLNENEEEAAEPKEETFEQKVAKVRGVYENIKSQFSETLTQLDKTNNPELEEFSGRIKNAYDQLDSIRYLFSRVGAFAKTSNKDVEELQQDYKIAKGKLTKAMSRAVSDLRAGQVDPNRLKEFLTDLIRVADWISTHFGVGPDEQYRVQGVTIQSDGKDKKETAENTDDSGGEPLTPEGSEEIEDAEVELEDDIVDEPEASTTDTDEEEVEKAIVDVAKFKRDSNAFIKNFTTPLFKILKNEETSDQDKINEINKLKTEMIKNRMLQEEDKEDIGTIVQKAYNTEATIKDLFRNIPTTEIIEIKKSVLGTISLYLRYRKKFDELQNTDFDEWNNEIDELTAELAKIAGKVVKQTVEEPEIRAALIDDIEDLGDETKSEIILQQRRKARTKEKERSRQSRIYRSMEKGSDPVDYRSNIRSTRYMGESNNLLERLIKEELKVLNGKKMVRN